MDTTITATPEPSRKKMSAEDFIDLWKIGHIRKKDLGESVKLDEYQGRRQAILSNIEIEGDRLCCMNPALA